MFLLLDEGLFADLLTSFGGSKITTVTVTATKQLDFP